MLAQTPPNAPAAREESARYEGPPDFLSTRTGGRIAAFMYKATNLTLALGETCAVLAAHFPSSPLAALACPNAQLTLPWLAGCALMCGGAALRLWCHRALGRFFTWELAVRRGHALVTRGPYAVVRHPSYAGSAAIAAGVLLCGAGPGAWVRECVVGWGAPVRGVVVAAWAAWTVAVPVMLVARVGREDAVMRREFGEEWEAYARRTPYRLLPWVY